MTEPKDSRDYVLDAVAELDAKLDRKLESVTKRLSALEGKRGMLDNVMDNPERIMFVFGIFYVASMLIPPLIAAFQKKPEGA